MNRRSEHDKALARAAAHFTRATADHTVQVLHDDGLYRHVRCAKPGTGIYSFNLITTPGRLIYYGDGGGTWVFSREQDMFAFFRRQRINPGYWAQKLTAVDRHSQNGSKPGESYAPEVARQLVREHAIEYASRLWDEAKAARFYREVIDLLRCEEAQWEYGFAPFLEELRRFDFDGDHPFEDAYEWSPNLPDHHFLWACNAIVWGIAQYDTTKTPGTASPDQPETEPSPHEEAHPRAGVRR